MKNNEENILNLDDFEIDEIESIELIGEEDTIDITVDDTHMFYANDIYTHNSSIGAELVEANQIGGSIKKGQIGHFIVSIAKTLEQKEDGTARLAILKSRFGKDGLVLDAVFDNGNINIEIIDNAVSFLQSKSKKEEETIINKKNKIKDLLKEYSIPNLDTNSTYEDPLNVVNNKKEDN